MEPNFAKQNFQTRNSTQHYSNIKIAHQTGPSYHLLVLQANTYYGAPNQPYKRSFLKLITWFKIYIYIFIYIYDVSNRCSFLSLHVVIECKGRVKKKNWKILTFRRPPSPPKVGKYLIFFYMTRRVNFFSSNFPHIQVMKHTISKNHHFQKKSLLCWGWNHNVPSHATYPRLGNACAYTSA